MKKLFLFVALAALLSAMSSCKRNYQVNYARVAVDTLRHNDMDSVDIYAEEDKKAKESVDEMGSEDPLFEIPDIPKERQIRSSKNKKAARDAETLYSGKELEE